MIVTTDYACISPPSKSYIDIATVKLKKLKDNAIIPTRGSEYAAGYDLYAAIDEPIQIGPGETKMIDTGFSMACPDYLWIGIFARSGLATKQGLRPANCVGVVDPDYRGPVMVALHNDTTEKRTIYPNDRVGQMILMPLFAINFEEEKELSSTKRGIGGFGSTG